jgi:putative transposase
MVRRRLQRNGLHFERIRYWSDVLPAIAQPREPLIVRYDPRDLSCVYVLGSDRHYHTVPYADLTHPPISLSEIRHLHGMLRTQAKGRIDEHQLFVLHQRQRQIVHSATLTTKAARRGTEKKRRHEPTALTASDSIDYSKDPTWLPSEIWEEMVWTPPTSKLK